MFGLENNEQPGWDKTEFPVVVDQSRRFLKDRLGRPFFYHADTGWKLFWEFTLEEAVRYLEDRRQKGFNVIQVQLLPHRDYQCNRYGEGPFLTRGDLTQLNPAYFDHVERIARVAEEKGVGLMVGPCWASKWEQDWYKHLNEGNAEQFGRLIGERFRDCPSVIGWIHGGDDDAEELHDAIRLCAQTLKAISPEKINTFHGNQRCSDEFFHGEAWYDLNMAYSYSYPVIVEQLLRARNRQPVLPVLMGETHYEGNDGISAALLRKFAHASVLLGGAGHTYGHKDIWIATWFWPFALDAPVVAHMRLLRGFFSQLDWSTLQPDNDRSFLLEGGGEGEEYAPAAVSTEGGFGVVYLPTPRTITVNLKLLGSEPAAQWYDPVSGKLTMPEKLLGDSPQITAPGVNAGGDGDWLLLLANGA